MDNKSPSQKAAETRRINAEKRKQKHSEKLYMLDLVRQRMKAILEDEHSTKAQRLEASKILLRLEDNEGRRERR